MEDSSMDQTQTAMLHMLASYNGSPFLPATTVLYQPCARWHEQGYNATKGKHLIFDLSIITIPSVMLQVCSPGHIFFPHNS